MVENLFSQQVDSSVKKYEKAVISLLKKHQYSPVSEDIDTLRDEIIIDKTNYHYQLVTVG